jgi:class 3 adenylate cyclase
MATRTLTILLADLVGSSAHLTTIPQKQAVEYLQDATIPIRETIEDYEGVVIKFTGDGYLATFESVAQALRAAEKIRHHFLRQTHTPTGISLDGVRVILNTADVTAQDNDVFGDGVALVSRLEKDVPTNQIYVTPAVCAIADDAEFTFELAGDFRPRGWHQTIKVYQLLPTEANFVDPNVFLLITDLHGLISAGESLSASQMNRWLLTWGDMHRQAVVGIKGRVRQFITDMALVTFATADDAAQGVINLRALAAVHNKNAPDLPPIRFAAAISAGDLILSPTGVVGRVVSQAFRLLHASPRETITIEAGVYEQLQEYQDRFRPVTRDTEHDDNLAAYEMIESEIEVGRT